MDLERAKDKELQSLGIDKEFRSLGVKEKNFHIDILIASRNEKS